MNTIIQFVLTVQTVGSSLYKKHKTTTIKSSFFGLLEGITLTGAVVIGVGALVVHSVYALYTGEPTLWDIATMNTGPIFTQPAQPTAAQPTAAIPAPEPAPVPVTETLSMWTRFVNWLMGSPVTTYVNIEVELQRVYNHIENAVRNKDTIKGPVNHWWYFINTSKLRILQSKISLYLKTKNKKVLKEIMESQVFKKAKEDLILSIIYVQSVKDHQQNEAFRNLALEELYKFIENEKTDTDKLNSTPDLLDLINTQNLILQYKNTKNQNVYKAITNTESYKRFKRW